MQKYKVNNLFDNIESVGSYLVIEKSNGNNIGKIVNKYLVDDFNSSSIVAAMEKYYYPECNYINNIIDSAEYYKNKEIKSYSQNNNKKLSAFRVILNTILTLGLTATIFFGHKLALDYISVSNSIVIGATGLTVSGTLVALVDQISYKIKSILIKKKFEKHLSKASEIVKDDKIKIDNFLNKIEIFKNYIDLANISFSEPKSKVKLALADINYELFKLFPTIYHIADNKTMLELTEKYKNYENCYKDTYSILKDYDNIRKILPSLEISTGKTSFIEEKELLHSARTRYSRLIQEIFIPITQALICTYDEASYKFVRKNYASSKTNQNEQSFNINKKDYCNINNNDKQTFNYTKDDLAK